MWPSSAILISGTRQAATETVKTVAPPQPEKKPVKTISESDKSNLRKELKKQQKQFQQLEKKLEELNRQKLELENRLTLPETYSNPEEFKKTEVAYKQVSEQVAASNIQYEQLFEKIMNLEEQLS